MGRGIAQVAAVAGYRTILYDINAEGLNAAADKLRSDLAMLVSKGKMNGPDAGAALERLTFTSDPQACIADLVIEAIVEKVPVKTALFQSLAAINGPDTIYASNTSSLSIDTLAAVVPDPSRFAGLHFFNPAPVMKLVEVVKGRATADFVIEALVAMTKQMGKVPVVCTDSPGFIVNRVARPYYIESLRLAETGVELEKIDALLEQQGFKMGPFKLMDLIGNDVNYEVSCSVYEQLGRPERLKPSHIQGDKVKAGALGRKTGEGYYRY